MAAEAIENQAKKRGWCVKVETRGSVGAGSVITSEEVAAADLVIVAADIEVDLGKFAGKPVYRTSTGLALKKTAQELDKALVEAEVLQPQTQKSGGVTKKRKGNGPYRHLLTGVSYMLPMVVAGGLCIALSFMFGIKAIAGFLAGYIAKAISSKLHLPQNMEALKPILIIPLLASVICGLIMIYVVGTPVAKIMEVLTYWLQSLGTANAVLLGTILRAMMCSDMGGPVNKAAYAFGVALLSSSVYAPMAAVKAALVLGLCFISEGGIPFAARDPMRVLPCCIMGGALTGGLSMVFGAKLMAPHGGLFVLLIPGAIAPVLLYLVAIDAGTLLAGVAYAWLKRAEVPVATVA